MIASDAETTASERASSAFVAASSARNLASSEAASDMVNIYHAGLGKPTGKRGYERNLSSLCRTLCPTRIAPIDAVEEIGQLGC